MGIGGGDGNLADIAILHYRTPTFEVAIVEVVSEVLGERWECSQARQEDKYEVKKVQLLHAIDLLISNDPPIVPLPSPNCMFDQSFRPSRI